MTLLRKLLKREVGSDLLGGISIVTSILFGEYLAVSIIVLIYRRVLEPGHHKYSLDMTYTSGLGRRSPAVAGNT